MSKIQSKSNKLLKNNKPNRTTETYPRTENIPKAHLLRPLIVQDTREGTKNKKKKKKKNT